MCQIKKRNDAKANFSTFSCTLLLKCVCVGTTHGEGRLGCGCSAHIGSSDSQELPALQYCSLKVVVESLLLVSATSYLPPTLCQTLHRCFEYTLLLYSCKDAVNPHFQDALTN